MTRLIVPMVAVLVALTLAIAGCTQAAPAPTPTKAPAAPTKVAEPTKPAAATAAPTKAAEPTKPAAQPTAAPAKKVDFPAKGRAITLIVPYDAGAGTDVGARLLAPMVEKELGTSIQIVNRPGAGGQLGLTEVAQARPDGYTLGATNLPTVMSLYFDPERKTAFNRNSFQPLGRQVLDPEVLAVPANSPFKSVKDVVDAAKANPEGIKLPTSGIKSDTHFGGLLFQKAAGVKLSFVHFSGGAPGITSMLGGHTDATIMTAGNFLSMVKSGQVRILAVMDRERVKFFPDVPTFESLGYKIYMASSRGWSAPGGTPKEVVDVLSGALKKSIESPEHVKKLEEIGLPGSFLDAAQFSAYWNDMEKQVKELLEEIK